jgi:hypothetical protein
MPLQKLDNTVGFADLRERLPFGSRVERAERIERPNHIVVSRP